MPPYLELLSTQKYTIVPSFILLSQSKQFLDFWFLINSRSKSNINNYWKLKMVQQSSQLSTQHLTCCKTKPLLQMFHGHQSFGIALFFQQNLLDQVKRLRILFCYLMSRTVKPIRQNRQIYIPDFGMTRVQEYRQDTSFPCSWDNIHLLINIYCYSPPPQ